MLSHAQPFVCSYQNLNFASLTGKIYVASDPSYKYSVGICQDFSFPIPSPCDGVGVCQSQLYNPSESYSLGDWRNAVWSSVVDKTNKTIGAEATLLSDASSCWTPSGLMQYTSTIQFVCPTGQKYESDGAAMSVSQTGTCSFVFVIQTTLACNISPTTNCIFEGRDFSSLAGQVFTGSDPNYNYAFTPCTTLTNSPCTDSSVCQTAPSSPRAYNLGTFSAQSTWSFIDPSSPATGVALNMLGPQTCWTAQGASFYNSTVYFKCSQHSSTIMQVSNNICDFEFVIPTELACPP